MARLPTVGGDDGNWGTLLNDFLSQSLNSDGTLKSSAVQSAGPFVQQGAQVITPMDSAYGAKGDGITDDTAAVQACINASHAGQVVDLSTAPTTYGISAPISLLPGRTYRGTNLNNNNVAGSTPADITALATFSGIAAVADNGALGSSSSPSSTNPLTISGLSIDLTNVPSGQTPDGIRVMAFETLIEKCMVRGSANSGSGIHITDQNAGGNTITNSMVEVRIVGNNVKEMAGTGILVDNYTAQQKISDGYCNDNIVYMSATALGASYNSSGAGIDIESAADWQVNGNHVYACPIDGIIINNAFASFLNHNKVDTFGLAGTSGVTFHGIYINRAQGPATELVGNEVDTREEFGASTTVYNYYSINALNAFTGNVTMSANSLRTTSNNPNGGTSVAIKASGTGVNGGLKLMEWGTSIAANSGVTLASNSVGTQGSVTLLRGPLPASSFSTPSSPSGTISTSMVMAGLGIAFTPTLTGKLRIRISGTAGSQTAIASVNIQGRYGTGTAPSNGAAPTGTTLGQLQSVRAQTTTVSGLASFFCEGVATNLTLGTAVWIDVSFLTGNASDQAQIASLQVVVEEIN